MRICPEKQDFSRDILVQSFFQSKCCKIFKVCLTILEHYALTGLNDILLSFSPSSLVNCSYMFGQNLSRNSKEIFMEGTWIFHYGGIHNTISLHSNWMFFFSIYSVCYFLVCVCVYVLPPWRLLPFTRCPRHTWGYGSTILCCEY